MDSRIKSTHGHGHHGVNSELVLFLRVIHHVGWWPSQWRRSHRWNLNPPPSKEKHLNALEHTRTMSLLLTLLERSGTVCAFYLCVLYVSMQYNTCKTVPATHKKTREHGLCMWHQIRLLFFITQCDTLTVWHLCTCHSRDAPRWGALSQHSTDSYRRSPGYIPRYGGEQPGSPLKKRPPNHKWIDSTILHYLYIWCVKGYTAHQNWRDTCVTKYKYSHSGIYDLRPAHFQTFLNLKTSYIVLLTPSLEF